MKRPTATRARPAAPSQALPDPASWVPGYPPSWYDRLKLRIDRLPMPYWLVYLFAGAVLLALETAVHASTPLPLFDPVRTLLSVMAVLFLLLMHSLDRLAARSFDEVRPVLRARDDQIQSLRYHLVTMSAREGYAAAGLGFLVGLSVLLVPYVSLAIRGVPAGQALLEVMKLVGGFQIAMTPASLALNAVLLVLTWCVSGTFVFHTVRRLVWVSRIYTRHTHIDLLRPGPLYRLSRVTAGTALVLMAVVYLWFAADPTFFRNEVNLASAAMMTLLASAAFFLPLLGIHRLLVAEKEHLLDACAERVKTAIAELHRHVDEADLSQADGLNKTIASLEIERNYLWRIPTWPWQPETLRTVLGALLLPLILWLAQAVLGPLLRS
jgi:hypothetical protein